MNTEEWDLDKQTQIEIKIKEIITLLTSIKEKDYYPSFSFHFSQNEVLVKLSTVTEELFTIANKVQLQTQELNASRQALISQHQHYQDLFEFATDGYIVTNTQGVIQGVNSAAANYLNYRQDLLISQSLEHFLVNTENKNFRNFIKQLTTGRHLGQLEISLKARDREPFPVVIFATTIHNSHREWVGIHWLIRDTLTRISNEQLYHHAFHDSLTDLPNRTLLLERLQHLLENYQRHPEQLFAVLFLDLDRFKVFNDSLGHLAGDQILIETAHRLLRCVRDVDTVVRLGGDEFVILLGEIHTLIDAEDCAERIKEVLAAPFTVKDQKVIIQCSIGIVLSSPLYQQPSEILQDADQAMYQAKHQGGNCCLVYTSQMHVQTLSLYFLEKALRQAVHQQEFEVFYQPIVSLKTHQLSGFEALVRWEHPQTGLLTPDRFLAIAESTGLIVPIGWQVMRTACKQIVEWQNETALSPALTVNVNLSCQQLDQPDLVAQIQSILQETGLKPECLTLEITESVLLQNIDRTAAALAQLQAFQIELEIDDFGTGFSSLSRLRRLSFDGLKIDRSFLIDIKGLEIVKIIIQLANSLGMYSVAEGVETTEQIQQLQSLKCEYAQGFFFGQPAQAELAKLTLKKSKKMFPLLNIDEKI